MSDRAVDEMFSEEVSQLVSEFLNFCYEMEDSKFAYFQNGCLNLYNGRHLHLSTSLSSTNGQIITENCHIEINTYSAKERVYYSVL